MLNIIKSKDGDIVNEPTKKYVIQLVDQQMFEADTYKELVAALIGPEYVDCDSAEVEWQSRMSKAQKIGLFINAGEDGDSVIVYDERIGKIPYSATEANPDYSIPKNAELIRVENDETFIWSLMLMRYVMVWEKRKEEYLPLAEEKHIKLMIGEELEKFRNKKLDLPLYQRQ